MTPAAVARAAAAAASAWRARFAWRRSGATSLTRRSSGTSLTRRSGAMPLTRRSGAMLAVALLLCVGPDGLARAQPTAAAAPPSRPALDLPAHAPEANPEAHAPEANPEAHAPEANPAAALYAAPEHGQAEDAPEPPSITEPGQHGEDGPAPSFAAPPSYAPPSADAAPENLADLRAERDPAATVAPTPRPTPPSGLRAARAGRETRPPAPRASAGILPAIAPPPRPAPPSARPAPDPGPRSASIALPPPALTPPPPPDPRASDKGLCGDWRLKGEIIPAVEGPGLCGIPQPVRITEVLGVRLQPAARLNCRAARTLASWMERGPVRMAPRALGAPLAAMRIGGTYSCRTRNSAKGAKLSEHSVGNAIDVMAFRLRDGREISPLRGWRKGEAGAFLLQAWRAACGPFGTVLGPDSDEHHRDHFHLDIAAHFNGPYCR